MRLPCKRWSDAAAKFGCIDILVNNAALYGALCGGRFEAIGEAEWDDAMRANVKGLWQCCKAVVPQMRKAGAAVSSTWPPLPRSTACRLRCTTRYRRRRWSD